MNIDVDVREGMSGNAYSGSRYMASAIPVREQIRDKTGGIAVFDDSVKISPVALVTAMDKLGVKHSQYNVYSGLRWAIRRSENIIYTPGSARLVEITGVDRERLTEIVKGLMEEFGSTDCFVRELQTGRLITFKAE